MKPFTKNKQGKNEQLFKVRRTSEKILKSLNTELISVLF